MIDALVSGMRFGLALIGAVGVVVVVCFILVVVVAVINGVADGLKEKRGE